MITCLKIKKGDQIKSYNVKENPSGSSFYIRVLDGYLPLTTEVSTINSDLIIKIKKNNQNYQIVD
jgi:hypothetical protein